MIKNMDLEILKLYLRIDDDSEDIYLNELIEVSQIYIDSMVGEVYKTDEKAVKLATILQKKLCNDLYSSRGTTIDNDKKDIIVNSILDKLALFDGDYNE